MLEPTNELLQTSVYSSVPALGSSTCVHLRDVVYGSNSYCYILFYPSVRGRVYMETGSSSPNSPSNTRSIYHYTQLDSVNNDSVRELEQSRLQLRNIYSCVKKFVSSCEKHKTAPIKRFIRLLYVRIRGDGWLHTTM